MRTAVSDKPKLWPEGLRLLCAHGPSWLAYAAWFVLALIPIDAWQISQSGPYHQQIEPYYESLLEAVENGQDMQNIETINDKIEAVPRPAPWSDIAVMVISLASLYFFCIYFMKRAPVLLAPKASLGSLFYSFGKIIQKYLIVFGVPLLLLLASIALGAIATGGLNAQMAILMLLSLIVIIMLGGYFFCRYTFVLPLAVNGIKGALKLSARLTNGNIWRLASAYAVITTIMLPPLLVMALVPMLAGTPDKMTLLALATFIAVSQVIVMGLFATFACAAFAILYNEKQAADPSFKLLTST